MFNGEKHPLRDPCKRCGGSDGIVKTVNGQDTIRCATCDLYCYNAPKTETGRAARTVTSVHNGIKPSDRVRVIMRANGQCELCRQKKNLHVGHLVSVKEGLAQGLTERQLNSDENFAALCDECNLGMGEETMPLWLILAVIKARTERLIEKNRSGESAA